MEADTTNDAIQPAWKDEGMIGGGGRRRGRREKKRGRISQWKRLSVLVRVKLATCVTLHL